MPATLLLLLCLALGAASTPALAARTIHVALLPYNNQYVSIGNPSGKDQTVHFSVDTTALMTVSSPGSGAPVGPVGTAYIYGSNGMTCTCSACSSHHCENDTTHQALAKGNSFFFGFTLAGMNTSSNIGATLTITIDEDDGYLVASLFGLTGSAYYALPILGGLPF